MELGQGRSCGESDETNLDNLDYQDLAMILADLMIVKYPGIEQADVEHLFEALDTGDMEQVEQVEADLAEKSARWKLAVLDLDDDEE